MTGECCVSTQVLNEFLNVATRKAKPPMGLAELQAHFHDLCAFEVVQTTPQIIEQAMRRHFSNRISYYDALVVETAIAARAEVLFSEDMQDGMQFDSLRIVNPFL